MTLRPVTGLETLLSTDVNGRLGQNKEISTVLRRIHMHAFIYETAHFSSCPSGFLYKCKHLVTRGQVYAQLQEIK